MYHPFMNAGSDVSVFILAGGKSTRMGADKAFVALHGRTLLAHMLELAREIVDAVWIVGDRAKFTEFGPVVEDVFPNCGPLGGIHAALRSSRTDVSLVLAVDVPFVTSALLRFLVARSRTSEACVTIVRTRDGWQPLCAAYRLPFADVAEKALQQGRYKIDDLFKDVSTAVITEEDLKAAGFSRDLFRNLNTPEELARATQSPLKSMGFPEF